MRPAITVSLEDSMSDVPVDIKMTGLKANKNVTLHSFTTIDDGNEFECVAQYKCDSEGSINMKTHKSIGGSYTGIEPMGLFWAMKPSLMNEAPHARFAKLDVTTPLVVTIKAYDASIKSLEEIHDMRKKGNLDQLELASVKVNRWFMAPGTKRITLTMEKDGIHGTLFIPPGDGSFPGVITMFGGYPGTMEFKAALLASHGFAALALAFYGVPGLPEGTVQTGLSLNLEYFESAIEFLSGHEKINSRSGIGIMGISMSSFIILAMSECIPNIKCVIWLSGFIYPYICSLSYKTKTYGKEPFDVSAMQPDENGIFVGRNVYPKYNETNHPHTDSKIKFYDHHNINYMFIAGLDDNNVSSEYHINKAERLLKEARHPNYQILRYPGAGHLIEPCYGIHNGITAQPGVPIIMDWGGEMISHCKAQEDSWPKQINFLKSNLPNDYSLSN